MTVTVKLHETELPAPLSAVQVTVVVPTGKMLPEGVVHVTGTAAPVQPSVAKTV